MLDWEESAACWFSLPSVTAEGTRDTCWRLAGRSDTGPAGDLHPSGSSSRPDVTPQRLSKVRDLPDQVESPPEGYASVWGSTDVKRGKRFPSFEESALPTGGCGKCREERAARGDPISLSKKGGMGRR